MEREKYIECVFYEKGKIPCLRRLNGKKPDCKYCTKSGDYDEWMNGFEEKCQEYIGRELTSEEIENIMKIIFPEEVESHKLSDKDMACVYFRTNFWNEHGRKPTDDEVKKFMEENGIE